MLGFGTFAALLPELRDLWGLSNAEAGLIASAFFIGYVASVSYWTALTDRTDGRRVYLAGCLLATAGGGGVGPPPHRVARGEPFHAPLGGGGPRVAKSGRRVL